MAPPLPEPIKAKARELRAAGWKLADIAATLEVSLSSAQKLTAGTPCPVNHCRIQANRAELRAANAERMRKLNADPEFAAAKAGRERQRLAGIERYRLAWCPPEWRDTYRKVKRKGQLSAAEARQLIEAEIARAQRRAA